MKKFILITLTLLPLAMLAQKVDKKTGAIMYNGAEIGTVEKSGGLAKSYTLFDASGEEIASFEPKPDNPQEEYFEIFFAQTDNKGTCPGNLSFPNKIAKAFVKSRIMKDGAYQSNKEARFISALMGRYYGGNVVSRPLGTEKVRNQYPGENNLLERNRDAMIQVFGQTVKQDFKEIARFEKTQNASQGTIVVRYKIYNHNGKQIAEASTDGVMNTKYRVVTLKDNETHFVEAESSLYIVRDIIKTLVDSYYL
jgi:hypothetical protein